MTKWADFVISQVSYGKNHLISKVKRHQDSDIGVCDGTIVDRLTIVSDIKNGFRYITVYNKPSSWKRGYKIKTFRIDGDYYLRIDDNKVKLDYLGDLPEIPSNELSAITEHIEEATPEQLARLGQLEKQLRELESKPEKPLPSPKGSLPQKTDIDLPQELELAPEPVEANLIFEKNKNLEFEHEILQILHIQNKKLDEIEKKLQMLDYTINN